MSVLSQQQISGLIVETTGDLLVYTFSDISRDTLDEWADHYAAYLHQQERPFRVLMDVSAEHLSFSPYFRSSSQRMIDAYGHIPGRMAVLSHNKLITSVVDLYMRMQRQKRFQVAFFTDRQAALKWLHEID